MQQLCPELATARPTCGCSFLILSSRIFLTKDSIYSTSPHLAKQLVLELEGGKILLELVQSLLSGIGG
jgi:hypothetical protein